VALLFTIVLFTFMCEFKRKLIVIGATIMRTGAVAYFPTSYLLGPSSLQSSPLQVSFWLFGHVTVIIAPSAAIVL
jgi:hypothetical protein